MPRPGPVRRILGIRIADSGHEAIEERAKDQGVTKSEMTRRLLAYGVTKMPKNWKP